ncbi:hypothetical protein [Crateriforma conspicua]|uniref:Uncharacterized protein n=1 Tax=Crateriforma conspicua TaxID=2527996 RepID=A0A5C6FXG1_9PLAN|nr:hypothetical protein [Crateriforma conspicua]TWU67609.1 hypothetical protein V7x_31840 [Crateriforma conspicua]
MAGDLEDFLKRAAAKRQAKAAAAQNANTRPTRSAPEYTDSRRERQIRELDDSDLVDEVIVGEVVETPSDQQQYQERRRRIEQAKKRAEKIAAETAKRAKKSSSVVDTSSDSIGDGEVLDPEQLMAMLRSPQGMRQAILLREILDRPEHRW